MTGDLSGEINPKRCRFSRGKISEAGGWILRKITGEMICHNFLLMTEDMKDHHYLGGGLKPLFSTCMLQKWAEMISI